MEKIAGGSRDNFGGKSGQCRGVVGGMAGHMPGLLYWVGVM